MLAEEEDWSEDEDTDSRATDESAGVGRASGGARDNVSDLPDLTDKLKEGGMYDMYRSYRMNYLTWRRGGDRGAREELRDSSRELSTEEANDDEEADPYKFMYWYPTKSIFKWRFTSAYWSASLSLMGAILFTYNAGIAAFHDESWTEMGLTEMTTWPNFCGGVCFVVANYFAYFQLINLPADHEDRLVHVYADWKAILERVRIDSCVGTLAYFIGACFFQVGPTFALYKGEKSDDAKWLLSGLPDLLGSWGFVIGGVMELTHNRIFCGGASCWEPVWWASIASAVGSCLFFLGALPGCFCQHCHIFCGTDRHMWVHFNYFVGSALFVISSVLLLVMWESNDFGFTLINQLNHAIKAKGRFRVKKEGADDAVRVRVEVASSDSDGDLSEQEVPAYVRRFSARGLIFLVLYCWFACVAIIVCVLKYLQYEHSVFRHRARLVESMLMQAFVVGAILIVLALHSAVVRVPQHQPYKCAVFAIRALYTAGAVVQTIALFKFIFVSPDYEMYLPGEPTSFPLVSNRTHSVPPS